ncbi:hypothetical protein BBF96_05670 [Anoxybacter fermentans]|uniref:Peptidase S8 n=1 Tax=Anoxybacter fermentans TaxID=1323375 RepID=A0A3Q9HQ46_9FIRM|nr:S8 family serine peptidase [Anoxybacter fermentans]AZR72923.1 hypothetical protein BBF96_05670 [Anoxybacter fermentans]
MRKFSVLLALFLVLTIAGMAFAASPNSKMDRVVADEITYKSKVDVIVTLVKGAKMNPHGLDGTVKHEYSIINGFAGSFTPAAIEALAKNPNVKFISSDYVVEVALNYGAPTIKAPDAWAAGYTGKGVTVAVIDTGIDPNHPALAGRIVGWYDAVNGQPTPYDDHGHGTHCAGIVGSNDSFYRGVAPEVSFFGVKVLDSSGSGTTSDIIAGIDWAVQNGADVISMSLGGRAYTDPDSDPLCLAVRNAWNSGVVVVVAAGNSGPAPRSIETPGIEPSIITVAAANDNDTIDWTDDSIASFSSRGPTKYGDLKPDVAAPGVYIISCEANTGGWVSKSGTSMATPHVAGAAALMLQANPNLTPDDIKTALMNTANDLGYKWEVQGAGEINVWAAINY